VVGWHIGAKELGHSAAVAAGVQMKRRDAIVGLVVAAMLSRAQAQERRKVYRIALVSQFPVDMSANASDPAVARAWGALFDELRRLGYVEGQNLALERYVGDGEPEHLPELAADAVRRDPDLIYTFSPEMLLALKAATTTIPVVGLTGDAVELGIISSLARPGGNITGSSVDAGAEVWGKRFDLLREAVPKLSRLGFVITTTRWGDRRTAFLRDVAKNANISLVGSPINKINEDAYRGAFVAMVQQGAEAVYVGDEPEHFVNMRLCVQQATTFRLPSLYSWREAVEAGGFMAYAFELSDLIRRNANIIDLILKGANPGDIPFYQARQYNLIINLKTATTLGITIPASLLARADEVLE
jgi:putative ABC transport system substrate-binding protein